MIPGGGLGQASTIKAETDSGRPSDQCLRRTLELVEQMLRWRTKGRGPG